VYEETKEAIIIRLKLLGWTQEEISAKLQELYPDAKGTSETRVQDFWSKNGNDDFRTKILADLKAGHTPETIAKRNNLPLILVWAVKLKGMNNQQRFEALKINYQPDDQWGRVRMKQEDFYSKVVILGNVDFCAKILSDMKAGHTPGTITRKPY
jgi:hypothetical protein